MDDQRPDPDALLAQVAATERRQHRGRLEADPIRPRYPLTEQGVGYRMGGE